MCVDEDFACPLLLLIEQWGKDLNLLHYQRPSFHLLMHSILQDILLTAPYGCLRSSCQYPEMRLNESH